MAEAALIIAGVSAAGTVIAAIFAGLAVRRSREAQGSADRSAKAAERSAKAAEEALDLERDRKELDRRNKRGANPVIRFNEGTRFYAWVNGPSDATAMTLRLHVGDWLGPEYPATLLQVRPEPHALHYQLFTDRDAIPDSVVDRMTGHLVGECRNQYDEPEPVRSAPFRVRIPAPGTTNLVTYEQLT